MCDPIQYNTVYSHRRYETRTSLIYLAELSAADKCLSVPSTVEHTTTKHSQVIVTIIYNSLLIIFAFY